MARRASRSDAKLETYWELTKRPYLSLWFILPLLLFFHIGTYFLPTGSRAPNDVLRFLRYFGAAGSLLPPLLLAAFLFIQARIQKEPLEFRPRVLGLMALESLVWAGPFILLAQFRSATARIGAREFLARAIDAVGAGLYEEFLFRVVFISLVLGFFVDLLKWRRDLFVCLGVVAGAALFAFYHFLPSSGEQFNWPGFNFLVAAGLLWGIAYMTRGFGIAVGTHVAWNLYLLVHMVF